MCLFQPEILCSLRFGAILSDVARCQSMFLSILSEQVWKVRAPKQPASHPRPPLPIFPPPISLLTIHEHLHLEIEYHQSHESHSGV